MRIDPVLVCRALGGVATLPQLLGQGVRESDLRSAVTFGRLARPRRGVWAVATLPEEVLHALRHSGRLACYSLLGVKGVWLLPDDDRLHLHLGRGSHLLAPDGCIAVVHQSKPRGAGGPVATTVVAALAELGRCLGEEHLVVALDSARRLRLVHASDLPTLRLLLPRALRPIVDASTEIADSGLESLVRWRLARRGIVAIPQHLLGDGGSRDLMVGDRLLIETDGGTHDDRRQRLKDMERDAFASARGYITLRFSYDQILNHWPQVEASILAVIAAGRHLRQR